MINVAVAGCGYWGPNLIRNLSSLNECQVKTLCDTDEKRLAHFKQFYRQVETTSSYDEVVADKEIDAIVIATPVQYHFDMAQKALKAGKHVFVEKPMAHSVAQAKEMVRLADEGGLTLMVGHTFVYSSPVVRIKELIDSGQLGDIQYISSRRLNLGLFQRDINVAWDLSPHDISIILFIMGKMPLTVNCQGQAHVNPDIEDVTTMTLTFDNNVMATIQSSWLDPNKVREFTFVGNKKMLVYDDIQPNEKIKIYDKRVDMPPHYDTFGEFQYSYHYGDMCCPYIKMVEPLRTECAHFLECIAQSKKPLSGGPEGLEVIRILEAASASIKKQGASIAMEAE
jgi:predicted dehydrogenase